MIRIIIGFMLVTCTIQTQGSSFLLEALIGAVGTGFIIWGAASENFKRITHE